MKDEKVQTARNDIDKGFLSFKPNTETHQVPAVVRPYCRMTEHTEDTQWNNNSTTAALNIVSHCT